MKFSGTLLRLSFLVLLFSVVGQKSPQPDVRIEARPGLVTPTPIPRYPSPRLLLHVTTPTRRSTCQAGMVADCSQAVTAGDVSPEGGAYFVYVLVDKGQWLHVARLNFGITYGDGLPAAMDDKRGIDVIGWKSCADIQQASRDSVVPYWAPVDESSRAGHSMPRIATGWGAWPEPNSSIDLAWSSEQGASGDPAVAGYFYLSAYSEDSLQITTVSETGACRVDDQVGSNTRYDDFHSAEIKLTDRGSVVFSPGAARPGRNPCGGRR